MSSISHKLKLNQCHNALSTENDDILLDRGNASATNSFQSGQSTGGNTSTDFISSYDPFLRQLNPLLAIGFKRPLEMSDLGTLPSDTSKAALLAKFNAAVAEEQLVLDPKNRSIWRILRKAIGYRRMIIATIFTLAGAGSQFASPEILKAISNHFTGRKVMSTAELGILIALSFIIPNVGSVLQALAQNMFNYIGIQTRNVITNAMFEKVLQQRATDIQSGMVINMMNVDCKTLEQGFSLVGSLILVGPFFAVAVALVYLEVGVSVFFGLAFAFVVMPMATFVMSQVYPLFRERQKLGDKRLKLENEIFTGIRVIKYYAWETPFISQVEDIRNAEIVIARKTGRFFAVGQFLNNSVPLIMPVVVFAGYIGLGNQLDSTRAFVTIQLLQILQMPIRLLADVSTQIANIGTSATRVLKFLLSKEMVPYVIRDGSVLDSDFVIKFDNACLGWMTNEDLERKQKEKNENAARGGRPNGGPGRGLGASGELVGDASGGDAGKGRGRGDATLVQSKGKDKNAILRETGGYEMIPLKGQDADLTILEPSSNRSIHTLMNISFEAKKGQLVAIVGSIGSGKSSLLTSLLDELRLSSGSVYGRGKISYHQQSAWIFNDTLRNNILFGQEFDEKLFSKVISASALKADIDSLPFGLDTEIGEKGINLSGGQKARVSFARSLYCTSDIYLLDDPLSAVDAHVSNVLFYQGIKDQLVSNGKTVLLATHQVQYLKDCDLIVVLENGEMKSCGSYESFLRSGIDIETIVAPALAVALAAEDIDIGNLANHPIDDDLDKKLTDTEEIYSIDEEEAMLDAELLRESFRESLTSCDDIAIVDRIRSNSRARSRTSSAQTRERSSTIESSVASKLKGQIAVEIPQVAMAADARLGTNHAATSTRNSTGDSALMTIENRDKGSVRWKAYWFYISAGRPQFYIFIIVVILGTQALINYANIWLTKWGAATDRSLIDGNASLPYTRSIFYLGQYAYLVVLGSFASLFTILANLEHRTVASKNIHRRLLTSVIHATMGFFDTTPLGRIMNVFSADIRSVDMMVAMSLSQVINLTCQLIGSVGQLGYVTKGTFLLALVPMIFIYYYFQQYYQKTNLELKRLDSIAISPIVSQFTETLHGVTSVRAYFGARERFAASMERSIMAESTAYYLMLIINSWKQIRLNAVGSCMSLFVYILMASTANFMSPGFFLVAITYTQVLPQLCGNMVTMITNAEASMNSVERVIYYVDDVPLEKSIYPVDIQQVDSMAEINDRSALQITSDKPLIASTSGELIPPVDWPSEGVVRANNIVVGYRTGPDVLKGVSFETRPHEKVGIVGRTGCGKSTTAAAMFRFENLRSGSIEIDGYDISLVPLHVLRDRIGIIPQDPYLWARSLRFNLDPFARYNDDEIWQVLDKVCMKAPVSNLPDKLDTLLSENGSNFSAGQKQLLCFARALLKKPKILILDEATASVDQGTDDIIQKMITEAFSDITVLTIAHRLNTIFDSDRIMVLDHGHLIEMDSAEKLLKQESGIFSGLWKSFQLSHQSS